MTNRDAKQQPRQPPTRRGQSGRASGRAKPAKTDLPHERKERPAGGPIPSVDPAIEQVVGVTVDELTALYLLDGLKGFGPQKFKELHAHGLTPAAVLSQPSALPTAGKRGDDFRRQLQGERERGEAVCRRRAATQVLAAHEHGARIVTYRDPHYPPNVFESNYPAPILFVRGAKDALLARDAVACVGSRKIRPPYTELETEFVRTACRCGFAVVAGFALGADTIGHEQAWKSGGNTICVMPGGLDRPFPPENRPLWDEFLRYSGAVFVSELSFGARASALTLRKRNKLTARRTFRFREERVRTFPAIARPTCPYGSEQSLNFRYVRELSSERFNQSVFYCELVMSGLPQFFDRLYVLMISIGTAGKRYRLADSCRDNLPDELAHIILIARSHSLFCVLGAKSLSSAFGFYSPPRVACMNQ